MAIQAPAHALRLVLIDNFHLVDGSMAAVTAHTAVYVHRMVKVSVVGDFVDSDPVDGLTSLPALTDGSKLGAIGLDLGMASHTSLSRRDIRMGGHLDEAMTITAIHAELLHVDHMRERHRLGGLVADSGIFGSEVIPEPPNNRRSDCSHANHQLQGKQVGPFWKKVRHGSVRCRQWVP